MGDSPFQDEATHPDVNHLMAAEGEVWASRNELEAVIKRLREAARTMQANPAMASSAKVALLCRVMTRLTSAAAELTNAGY
jgi:hypothetical protein